MKLLLLNFAFLNSVMKWRKENMTVIKKILLILLGIFVSCFGFNKTYEEPYQMLPLEENIKWGMTENELIELIGEADEVIRKTDTLTLKYYNNMETLLGTSAETSFVFGKKKLKNLENALYTIELYAVEFFFTNDTYEQISNKMQMCYGKMQKKDIKAISLPSQSQNSMYMEKWANPSWCLNQLSDEYIQKLYSIFGKNTEDYVIAQDDFLISVTVIGKDKEVPPVKVTMDASYLLHLQHALNNN